MLFGLIGLITGPLWARKAWGVWWQWDARLTSALVLWLIFVAYLLLRKYGGPGSEKLCGGGRDLRHGQRAVRLLVGERLADRSPDDHVVPTLKPVDGDSLPVVLAGVRRLFVLLLAARVRLENRRAELEALYLSIED